MRLEQMGPAGPVGQNGFPQRLRGLRTRRQLNAKALSELCGLSPAMVCRYERGEREPSLQSLVALADFFDVSTDYLLGRE